jgi:hypothetical protein
MEAEATISEQLCGLINVSNPLQLCRYVGSPRLNCPAQPPCRAICGPLLRALQSTRGKPDQGGMDVFECGNTCFHGR